jgi:hypothetical protein
MLSIAIPTMRRWSFLKSMLPIFLERPEVSEVILCDETGEDAEEARRLYGTNPKLRVYVNETRLGIYENKCKVLGLATGWVALLDSDNVFPEEWFEVVKELDYSDTKKIYGSADFKTLDTETNKIRTPCIQFSGTVLNKSSWNYFLHNDKCFYLLNDGNWILHRSAVELLPKIKSESLHASDAIFILYVLMVNDYTIEYPAGLEYIHMTHPGSSWLQSQKESLEVLLKTNWKI